MDYVSSKEKRYSGSYIQSTVKVVKFWLGYNSVELKRRIKVNGATGTPSLIQNRQLSFAPLLEEGELPSTFGRRSNKSPLRPNL